ncbi:hypothetical protein GXW74_20095 [Roseomonas eburnea]|uniref:Uncharacterized protein n=1 Tax=Neoroseomonas eburnea TaxID=1346889 RepID=A0A9X9XGG9_9PROT|nr:hypothetical protein [Neoroseomonas eburnea]MBR0682805.1 hypothetical protein [Neoroseomonas eburnea]
MLGLAHSKGQSLASFLLGGRIAWQVRGPFLTASVTMGGLAKAPPLAA